MVYTNSATANASLKSCHNPRQSHSLSTFVKHICSPKFIRQSSSVEICSWKFVGFRLSKFICRKSVGRRSSVEGRSSEVRLSKFVRRCSFVGARPSQFVRRSSSVEAGPSKFVCRNLFVEVRLSEPFVAIRWSKFVRRSCFVEIRLSKFVPRSSFVGAVCLE